MQEKLSETALPANREMERVLRTIPVESSQIDDPFETRIVRWEHGPLHDVVKPMSDHVLMTFRGPMQRFERRSGRDYIRGTARLGGVTFIPAGSSSRWDIHGPLDVIQLYLSPSLLEDLAEREGLKSVGPLIETTAAQDNVTATLLGLAHQSPDGPASINTLYRQQLSSLIALHVLKIYSGVGKSFEKAVGGLSPKTLRTALERLQSDMDKDISLRALAEEAHLSRFHFCRAFKQSTGLSPHEWLRERQIEKAMTMLRDPSVQITDVAGMIGYSTLTAFGAAFKRQTGLTPGEFRRAAL